MGEILGQSEIEKSVSFYKDHVLRFGRKLSFSVLFLLQPEGGNGLQKLTLNDIKDEKFSLDEKSLSNGEHLFITICTELYGLGDFKVHKEFVTTIKRLYLDKLLDKERANSLSKRVVQSIYNKLLAESKKDLLKKLLSDFPEYKEIFKDKLETKIVSSSRGTVAELLQASIDETSSEVKTQELAQKLIGILIINSKKKQLSEFKSNFLLLERANAKVSSRKNIAKLLLVRYYVTDHFESGETEPTRKYLLDEYKISLDELLIIIDKKNDGKLVQWDSIKRLINSFDDKERNESVLGKKRIYNIFDKCYDEGNHYICYYLSRQFDFLKDNESIKNKLQHVSSNDADSHLGGRMGKKKKNINILESKLQGFSIKSLLDAESFIYSSDGLYYLRDRYATVIGSNCATMTSEQLDVAMEALDNAGKPISHDLLKTYAGILLVEGKNDNKKIDQFRTFMKNNKELHKEFGIILHDNIISKDIDFFNKSSEIQYPKETFEYLHKLRIFKEDSLKIKNLGILIKINRHLFSPNNIYTLDVDKITTFKDAVRETTGGLSKDKIREYLQSLAKPENGSIYIYHILSEYFSHSDLQMYFEFEVNRYVKMNNYDGIKQLLKKYGAEYTYNRKEIMNQILSGLLQKHKIDEAKKLVIEEQLNSSKLGDIAIIDALDKIENAFMSTYVQDKEFIESYNKSEAVKDAFEKKINEGVQKRGELKGTELQKYMDRIIELLNRKKQDNISKRYLSLVASRVIFALEGYSSLNHLDLKYRDLYLTLKRLYSKDYVTIHEASKSHYRLIKDGKIEGIEDIYVKLDSYCDEMIEYFGSIELDGKEKYLTERKELKNKNKLREFENKFTGISRLVYLYFKNRNGSYSNKNAIEEGCKNLLEQAPIVFLNAKDLERNKKKIFTMRFEYYEGIPDYDGIDMLEHDYGFRLDRREKQIQQLKDFLEQGDVEEVKQLTELIALFGMSNAADILYQLYPQYKGLPIETIKSILSHYLGDLLINHSGLGLHHIPKHLNITGPGFTNSLLTVIEEDFVTSYTQRKKNDVNADNKALCERYLIALKDKFDSIVNDHQEFSHVVDSFSQFLESVLEVQKPDHFVEYLIEGREFPDFLQRLNAALVKEKRRFLIADGMGMGKSLSAILAKEHCGSKSCLIIVPSSVTGTWEGYLSDVDDKARKKRGYYKKGLTPNVHVINSRKDLEALKYNSFDYVVISQEKLQSDEYVYKLIGSEFDFMIVDEIHKLKNIDSGKRASGLLTVTQHIEEHGGNVCLLSGTPIPNKIADIAVLLKLLYPEKFGTMENKDLVHSIIQGGDTLNLRSLLLPMMQMKRLTDHIDMPDLKQTIKHVPLSEEEQLYYDTIVEDNSLTGPEKVMILRKFLLNPQLAGMNQIEQGSKAKIIGEDANELFKEKNKIIFFANGFRDGILREKEGVDKTFIEQMNLDDTIEIRIIDGTNPKERQSIQDEFNSSDKKIALFISGSTADVGIDLSGGEHIIHINNPRTMADKDQQEARVYRFGQENNIKATTYVNRGTLEQGISDYIKMKHMIILKLYHGIKLSELERRVITEAELETKKGPSDSVNTMLTNYIRTSKEKLNNMFGYLREGGLERIENLVERKGKQMAEYYEILGPRSYQANVNRIHGTIIKNLIDAGEITGESLLDLGSGPKMLQKQLDSSLQDKVISVDINPHHFSDEDIENGKAVVANFSDLPFEDGSQELISSSLSFNETARSRSKKNHERLGVLLELNRVLKEGGIVVMSTIYSLQYKYPHSLVKILDELGFEILENYSGVVQNGSSFSAKTLVLRKVKTYKNKYSWYYGDKNEKRLKEIDALRKHKDCKGLDMMKDKISLSGQEYVLEDFEIIPFGKEKGKTFEVALNKSSKYIKQSEASYRKLIDEMKTTDEVISIADIKDETLMKRGFGRYKNKSSCVLMVRLPNNAGLFRYSEALKN